MTDKLDYYVYVYIDPRNFEEFYYGEGTRGRKHSHLDDKKESKKTKRINAIRKAGLEPIVKVIARNLTKHEALLVEKTLIWKLGRNLTNVSSGHFVDNFRPPNTIYRDLQGFDYENSVYLLNVGEGLFCHRSWEDCRKYGFMSAGQEKRYRRLMQKFKPGDIVAAYWSQDGVIGGYVGIGIVKTSAVPVLEFRVDGKLLRELKLTQPNIFDNCDNPDMSEWVIAVEWASTVPVDKRKWVSKVGLFSTPSTMASLEKQIKTLHFLEVQFDVKFDDLRKNDNTSVVSYDGKNGKQNIPYS